MKIVSIILLISVNQWIITQEENKHYSSYKEKVWIDLEEKYTFLDFKRKSLRYAYNYINDDFNLRHSLKNYYASQWAEIDTEREISEIYPRYFDLLNIIQQASGENIDSYSSATDFLTKTLNSKNKELLEFIALKLYNERSNGLLASVNEYEEYLDSLCHSDEGTLSSLKSNRLLCQQYKQALSLLQEEVGRPKDEKEYLRQLQDVTYQFNSGLNDWP